MTTRSLTISNRMPAAVNTAIAWSEREGWDPVSDDARAFAAADPSGYLLGEVDGEPIATISVVKYNATLAFLGMYIVAPGYRGRGYGMAAWRAGLASAGTRNIGLDGVVAQQENYRRSGFAFAYRNIRFAVARPNNAQRTRNVVPLAQVPQAHVLAYDRRCFPASRTAFLAAWLANPRATALGVLRDGVLAGYGVIRPVGSGWKIGPLFADDARAADTLFQSLAVAAPADAQVMLDVPEPNVAGLALAQRYGMRIVFETARMYTGPAPDVPLARVFGVTTFELG